MCDVTRPRSQQISLDDTPFYMVTSRCVRKAFLCGFDRSTNRSYEHRRQQIQNDMLRLASIFFIDIAAFAILHNHYHIVLHVRRDDAMDAAPQSIVGLAHQLVAGNEVTQRFANHEPLAKQEQDGLDLFVDTWRNRLFDISWFMKYLNEGIARRANQEDECKGHFWESRFKSQALLDDQAVLSAMAYVDLNPIRSALASTPEESDYTSIKERIDHWKEEGGNADTSIEVEPQPEFLMKFAGRQRQDMPVGLAFNLVDYIDLVEWTGRAIRDDKRGYIHEQTPPMLQRLGIAPVHWLELSMNFEGRFKGIVGCVDTLKGVIRKFGLKRCANFANSKLLFS